MKSTVSQADAEHIKIIHSELQAQNNDLQGGAVEVTLLLAVLMGQDESGLRIQAGEPGSPFFWAKTLISTPWATRCRDAALCSWTLYPWGQGENKSALSLTFAQGKSLLCLPGRCTGLILRGSAGLMLGCPWGIENDLRGWAGARVGWWHWVRWQRWEMRHCWSGGGGNALARCKVPVNHLDEPFKSSSCALSGMHRRNTNEMFSRAQNSTKDFTDKLKKINKSLAKGKIFDQHETLLAALTWPIQLSKL